MNINKTRLKERAFEEAKRFAVLFLYLWALLMVFEVYKSLILRTVGSDFGYQFGFAFVKALILAKFLLIAETLYVPKSIKEKPRVYSIFFKTVFCSAMLICLDILEEGIVGKFHGKSLAQSLPPIIGGDFRGLLFLTIIAFVVLIPLFAFSELGSALGEGELYRILFKQKSKPTSMGLANSTEATGPGA